MRVMDVLELRQHLSDEQIAQVVDAFYRRVQEDELLGPVFAAHVAADTWPAHLARMVSFWSTILRGTGTYLGNPMAPHQALSGIRREHFTRWLALFGATARELLPERVAAAILQRAERMGGYLQRGMGLTGS